MILPLDCEAKLHRWADRKIDVIDFSLQSLRRLQVYMNRHAHTYVAFSDIEALVCACICNARCSVVVLSFLEAIHVGG